MNRTQRKLKKIEKQTLARLHEEKKDAILIMHLKHKTPNALNEDYANEYNQNLSDGVKKVSNDIKEHRKYITSIQKR